MRRFTIAFACAVSLAAPAVAANKAHNAKVSTIFDQKLPNVPGKSMRVVLVEYGPGGSNPSHMHPKTAFIYATVLEGNIKSQVNDGELRVYKTGEHWIEVPGDHHKVSANASTTESAKLMAVFVVDTNETELVTPDK